jgi:importin-7
MCPSFNVNQMDSIDGILGAVMQLIVLPSSSDSSVRQAAAIYVKNRVIWAWSMDPERNNTTPIAQSDRVALKQNMLHALVIVPPLLKNQLKTALGTMITADFPHAWPGLLETVVVSLNSDNEPQLEAGLLALIEIFRAYR